MLHMAENPLVLVEINELTEHKFFTYHNNFSNHDHLVEYNRIPQSFENRKPKTKAFINKEEKS